MVSTRTYSRERERNLALMMDGFASEADNPDNCAHALRTLMVYDQHSWFHDVQKSYGLRFENNRDIQYLLAQGLCCFGDYQEAITYCRKAIVLGAGKPAEELLEFCQTVLEAVETGKNRSELEVQPESSLKAYIPIGAIAISLAICLTAIGVSSMRNYKAWIVNGSLRPYSFTLDDECYTLNPGDCRQITLRLGEHELKTDQMPANRFTYSIPLIKQLMEKHMPIIINPDGMALICVKDTQNGEPSFSFGEQIRILPGIGDPLHGLHKETDIATSRSPIHFYRPETHMDMVALMREQGLHQTATDYARQALTADPATKEASELLDVAAGKTANSNAEEFLRTGLRASPALLPWHLKYQDHMMIHRPEHDLQREYTLLCKNHPDDLKAYYLLGRVVGDRPSAYKFFSHSEQAGGMNGAGYNAIARDLYIQGKFRDALPYSQKALASNGANAAFQEFNEEIHLALRDYNDLIEHLRSSEPDPGSFAQAKRAIIYLTCAGYHKEAEAEAARLSQQQENMLPALNAIRFYCVGNVDDYLACLLEAGDQHAEIEQLLHQQRIEEAWEIAARNEEHPYWEHLVFYCAAMNMNLSEIAAVNLQKAIAEAGNETVGMHHLGRLLSSESAPTADAVLNLDIEAKQKAVLCVALGYRFPEEKDRMFRLAAIYNFHPSYPQLLLKKWMRAKNSIPQKADQRIMAPAA